MVQCIVPSCKLNALSYEPFCMSHRWHRIDDHPEVEGSIISKVSTYNEMHLQAVEMGYPSLLEALEALDRARQAGFVEEDLKKPALIQVSVQDPGFDPAQPVMVNGYLYCPETIQGDNNG